MPAPYWTPKADRAAAAADRDAFEDLLAYFVAKGCPDEDAAVLDGWEHEIDAELERIWGVDAG